MTSVSFATPASTRTTPPPTPASTSQIATDAFTPVDVRYSPRRPWAPARLPEPSRQRNIQHLAERLGTLAVDGATAARLAARMQQHAAAWLWFDACMPQGPTAEQQEIFAQHLQSCQLPFLALVLTCLQTNTQKWLSRRRRGQMLCGLDMLTRGECAAYAQLLFARPQLMRQLRAAFGVQERLELYQRGDGLATYLRFLQPVGRAAAALPQNAAARAAVAAMPQHLADQPRGLENGWQAHGRTLHFRDPQGQAMGLKLQKSHDDALHREDIMDRFLDSQREPLQLLSDLPRSRGVLYLRPDSDMRAAIAEQATYRGEAQFSIPDDELVTALLYEAPEDYHLHLHEVASLAELRSASHRAMHDAGTLAGRLGLVHTAPADLYHNKEKNRRYFWNVDQVHRAVGRRLGTGRLDRWERSINFNNLGLHGCRDLKHFGFYQDLTPDYNNDERLALTSAAGDMLFVWSLSVAKWFKDHDALTDTLNLADTLLDGFVAYFTAFTERPEEECRAFLQEAVQWDLIAEQMLYFMSDDYVADVSRHKMKPGIAGSHAAVPVKIPTEGWDPTHGWMLDGVHRDLGPKNGPFPVTELVAALYVSTSFAVQMRQ